MRTLWAILSLCLLWAGCAGEAHVGDGHFQPVDALTVGDGAPVAIDGAPPSPDQAATIPCGEFEGVVAYTCSGDGYTRGKCEGGVGVIETCARGCLRRKDPAEDICLVEDDEWFCEGLQGTSKALDGDYYITHFGCWVDDTGTHHKDPYDNCIPGCLTYAKQDGLCQSSWSGPVCEEKVVWYTANNGRFGCLSRLRITNPANGREVIAVVLDGGPSCSAEQKIQKAMLDVSTPTFNHLFEDGKAYTSQSEVHVIEVDESTPLGIVK